MAGLSAAQEGHATASGSCRVADRWVNSSVNQLSSTGLSWRSSGGEQRAVRNGIGARSGKARCLKA
jgi:hypothetical protein